MQCFSCMRSLSVNLFLLGALAVLTTTSAQASPVSSADFTYQGFLQDNGQPANGSYDFRFTIFDHATQSIGNNVTPPLDVNAVSVVDGVFTVDLDYGSIGVNQIFNGDEMWLQIEVSPSPNPGTYVTLSPRQPIKPVPYAIHALNASGGASGLWADDGSNMWNTLGGEVGVGRDPSAIAGGEKLEVGGNLQIFRDDLATNPIIELWNGYFLGQPVGGRIQTYDKNGTPTAFIGTFGAVGGAVVLRNSAEIETARLLGSFDGTLELTQTEGGKTVQLMSDAGDGGAELILGSVAGDKIFLHAEPATGSSLTMLNGQNPPQATLLLNAGPSGGHGRIEVRTAYGTEGVTLYGDYGDGYSRVVTDVIQINGGADLSERFDVNSAAEAVVPGTVVSIDPTTPGRLTVSARAYDRAVAGVISGAGGVAPGMLMGHQGTLADGEHPVALSGRVYAMADASNGPIEPGDLLTTSDVAGHAMKVSDQHKAQGAILGKAMTSLREGRGLVLVLVSLQ